MAYEAVPDDVEIQKLTSAQRDALSRHKIHENINTFLGNETTPLLFGGVALLAITPILMNYVRALLVDAGTIIPDVQWDEIKENATSGIVAAAVGAGPQIFSKEGILFGAAPKWISDLEKKYEERFGR